jgi:Fe-S cluster assembly protein SufD
MNSVTDNINGTAIPLKERLLADFQAWESHLNTATSPLHLVRREAIRQFDRLGFPTTKHEEWKYSNVTPITKQAFDFQASSQVSTSDLEQALVPDLDANVVIFINGIYQESLSRFISPKEQVRIENFADAYQHEPETFEQHFAQSANYEKDAFTALSTAFAQHGVFLRVPDGKIVEKPVVIYFFSDARTTNVASQPRNLYVIGKNSQVKIVEVFQSLGEKASFTNIVTEVSLAPEAYVEYYKVQNEGGQASHIGTTQVNQQGKSHFFAGTASVNGGFVRNNLNIVLDGEYCETNLYGLYIPDAKQHVDNHTVVDHAKPNSYSNELYKGIMNGRSTGVFNGKIFVRPDAQKTNAFQSNRNIILSNDASMNTKPQLEIFADDVKCSHGTTTGQLDEDALFYLRARGIGEDNAKALLMVAFAGDIINQIRIPALQHYLENLVAEKLGKR